MSGVWKIDEHRSKWIKDGLLENDLKRIRSGMLGAILQRELNEMKWIRMDNESTFAVMCQLAVVFSWRSTGTEDCSALEILKHRRTHGL